MCSFRFIFHLIIDTTAGRWVVDGSFFPLSLSRLHKQRQLHFGNETVIFHFLLNVAQFLSTLLRRLDLTEDQITICLLKKEYIHLSAHYLIFQQIKHFTFEQLYDRESRAKLLGHVVLSCSQQLGR